MLVWLTLPFYDFCGFRSVAVNSVYKLQFFTFIRWGSRLDESIHHYKGWQDGDAVFCQITLDICFIMLWQVELAKVKEQKIPSGWGADSSGIVSIQVL